MPTTLNSSPNTSDPNSTRINGLTYSYMRKRKPKFNPSDKSDKTENNGGFSYACTPPFHLLRGIVPTNLAEEKEKFLKFGQAPEFKIKDTAYEVKQMMKDRMAKINFSLFHVAKRILDSVVKSYGSLDKYVASTYGERITTKAASVTLKNYLTALKLEKQINVIWCDQLAASAQMTWIGPDAKLNKPESRRYTLLIKSSSENNFVRERGISCLADHEIGTHYIRSTNDGLQPWFADRRKYGLTDSKSYDVIKTEEGLAALHTLLAAKYKFLCMPALLYYNACMAEYLSFTQLFQHLERYMKDPEQRWKHCMRVKRGLQSTEDRGGYGKDQRYFEGAVEIMRHLDTIDFNILICGRICWNEIERVKRVCRLSAIKIPIFMQCMSEYLEQLQEIAEVNKIRLASAPNNGMPSDAELRKTREELLEDIHGFTWRTLDYRTILLRSRGYGIGDSNHSSRSRKYLRQQQLHGRRDSSPKPSTREGLISELATTHLLKLNCDEPAVMFIEVDLRHPIVNRKDYENVMRA